MSTTNLNETARIFDYFVVCGLPPVLTKDGPTNLTPHEHEQLLFKNIEMESSKIETDKLEPIVDIAILNKSLNEVVPHGYECLWLTPAGHSANLTPDFFKQSEMFILIRRGLDKPPISDIGIFYDGGRERIMDGCTVINKTVDGHSANLNQASNFNADKIFVTYRRSTELSCNALAVIDVCVILKSKGENAPHSYNEIKREINKGLFGPSVFICYKKAWIPAPQIKYIPSVLYRYPTADHSYLPFPNEIAQFGLPMGATIEAWPKNINRNSFYLKPSFSTFVLNINSDDGIIMEKVYGTALTFYEDFETDKLLNEQKMLKDRIRNDLGDLHSIKCLVLLSRFSLFDTFKKFLLFLFDKYTNLEQLNKRSNEVIIPIERYLSYLIFEVPFPTQQKPTVLVNLNEREEDCLSVHLPYECILPQS